MRVLQFIPSVNAYDGGTATYMQQLTTCLGKLCDLHVCVLSPVEELVVLDNCQIHSIPKSLLHLSEMKRAWISLLEEIQPDVVHINCCWLPQIALVTQWTYTWKKRLLSIPNCESVKIGLTPHGMLEPWIIERNYWTRKLPTILLYQRRAVKLCDFVIATSEEEQKHLLQLGWNRNVSLIQNGIDVEAVKVKTTWRKPKELLFMSRIHPKKGLELLFDAMSRIPSPCFHLTVAGTGDVDYISDLKNKVSSLNLSGQVSFVGAVYGEQKWKLIRDADILVLPSYSENYGLIVAEALASGTPVITTKGTPWRSLVEHSCGWWIAPDVAELTSVLMDCINKSEVEMTVMGTKARILAEIDCAVSQKVADLYQLYLSKNTQ